MVLITIWGCVLESMKYTPERCQNIWNNFLIRNSFKMSFFIYFCFVFVFYTYECDVNIDKNWLWDSVLRFYLPICHKKKKKKKKTLCTCTIMKNLGYLRYVRTYKWKDLLTIVVKEVLFVGGVEGQRSWDTSGSFFVVTTSTSFFVVVIY